MPDQTSDTPLSIRKLQAEVDQWINRIGVRYFSELGNLAQLTEEVGELARIINRTYGEQSWKSTDKRGDIGDELADVLFVLVCLANQTNVDLEQAIKDNLDKKTNRDRQRHISNEKLNRPADS